MKVVILGTRGFPNVQGGVEKHCEQLAINLIKLSCKVTVFTRKPYVNPKIKEYKGIQLISIPTLKNKFFEAFLHTFLGVLLAVKYRPDILHIQAIGPGFFIPLARLLGFRVVLTSHGSNYEHLKWGGFAKLFLRFSEFIAINAANKIIAISANIANDIKKKYKKEVRVIPNGVNIPKIVKSNTFLMQHNLESKKYILTVGRFVPEKGFSYLIDAFNQSDLPDWKLVIAGDADHETVYSKELKVKAGKNKNIVLTGFISGTPLNELYSHGGLFVLPSYYEGLPIVLLEAMSYGLSSIVSHIEANKNVKLDQDRYFEPGNTNGLSLKLMDYTQKKTFTELEKNLQIKYIINNFDWQKIALSTRMVYSELLPHK